jgi:hypothetical protein
MEGPVAPDPVHQRHRDALQQRVLAPQQAAYGPGLGLVEQARTAVERRAGRLAAERRRRHLDLRVVRQPPGLPRPVIGAEVGVLSSTTMCTGVATGEPSRR